MGDVVEASRIFNEVKANRAAVDANRKLVPVLPPDVLLLFFAAEPDISKDAVGWRWIPAAAVERVRHEFGEEDAEEDGDCRSGPRTFNAAAAVLAVEEVDEDVEAIVLLLIARHDDDKSAERVAAHAAQDAIFLAGTELDALIELNQSINRIEFWLILKRSALSRIRSVTILLYAGCNTVGTLRYRKGRQTDHS